MHFVDEKESFQWNVICNNKTNAVTTKFYILIEMNQNKTEWNYFIARTHIGQKIAKNMSEIFQMFHYK